MAYTPSGISHSLRLRSARLLLDGVKTGIEHQSPEAVAQALSRSRGVLGGAQSVATVTEVVSGRLSGTIDHAEATAQLEGLALRLSERPLHPAGWFALEHLARAIGCFVASMPFGQQGREQLLRRPTRQDRERTEVFLAHLYQRNLEGAIRTWHTRTPRADTAAFWADASQLLWLLTRGDEGVEQTAPPLGLA